MRKFFPSVAASLYRFLGAMFVAGAAVVHASPQEYTIHGTDIKVHVYAQQTAGELYDQCNFDTNVSDPSPENYICVGYLSGAEDGMSVIWAAAGEPSAYCKPDDTARAVLLRAFLDYVKANPDKRDLPAALVVLQAYRSKFPCSASPTK